MRESLLLHSTNIVVYPNILLFMGLHYFISFAVFVVQFSRCVLNGCLLYNRRLVGTSGFEPPTSRLSGVRSNRLSYKPIESGIHLLSHAVSSIVPSAAQVLTVVFGMGTGVSPERIDTRNMKLSF